jgi:hypothetical protein
MRTREKMAAIYKNVLGKILFLKIKNAGKKSRQLYVLY